jgi:hypothetical protein
VRVTALRWRNADPATGAGVAIEDVAGRLLAMVARTTA